MAFRRDLVIDQGTDFTFSVNVTDDNDVVIDLTGYSGAAQLRKHPASNTYYSFTVSINTTSSDVTLSVNNAVSNTIPAGRYVYDCELTNASGVKSRLVEGLITISPQVTR